MGKDVRIAVRVTAKEKERIQAKARKCGLSTTEYIKQRALGYEPRAVPPDALLLALKGWVSLRIKPVHRSWTRKFAQFSNKSRQSFCCQERGNAVWLLQDFGPCSKT